MGLAFSVPERCNPLPPSLLNIFKQLKQEYPDSFVIPSNGSLIKWRQQGVLLLNATLTVRAHEPASHSNRGWENFTDFVVNWLNCNKSNLVFMLWGNHAQKKGSSINKTKHLVLTAAHPSPLSANRGFFGCNHFTKTNQYLQNNGSTPIDWTL
jgi:uracil-DNA glycosylase